MSTSAARILLCDDSVVIRMLLKKALSSESTVEVIGTAENGVSCLRKIELLNPDLVVLDVEMPQMDGLETLVEIRKKWSRLPVVMFSTLTERGGVTTIEALTRGASDYVAKPANVGDVAEGIRRVQQELLPKIQALCGVKARRAAKVAARPAKATPARASAVTRSGRLRPPEVVVIGSSTGGPNALAEVVPLLPRKLAVPVLIVQHMPPLFTKLLAERLNNASPFPVREAHDGARLNPGEVWIAPGDHHMVISNRHKPVIELNQDPPENSCRPAVDPLFRSVAKLWGPDVLAVVMTGMGSDGREGSRAIRAAGGFVIAQDQATSVVWGMPGAVVEADLAHRVLPLQQLGPDIARRVSLSAPRSVA